MKFQSPHPISSFQPFRTTSLVQTFKEKPGHEQEKPYTFRVPLSPESLLQSNFDGAWSQIMLTDARGHEDLFTLDRDGFEWITHTCQVNVLEHSVDFSVHAYMNEMSEFLRQYLDAQEVFIYDYVQRSPDQTDRKNGCSDITRRIHCGWSLMSS